MGHWRSRTWSNGTRLSGGRLVRQYWCQRLTGERHTFYVELGENPRPVTPQPMPPCPRHGTAGKVTRYGIYGEGRTRRQRYWCSVEGPEKPGKGRPRLAVTKRPRTERNGHAFTPDLPREHVHSTTKPCPVCEEKRGIHRGTTAAARRHRWTTLVVAETLKALAEGAPYGKASVAALARVGISPAKPRRKSPPKPVEIRQDPITGADVEVVAAPPKKKLSIATLESRRAWRIAANWVDAFAPVIWQPLEADLRAEAMAERTRLDALIAAGAKPERPQIIVVDDIPVWGRQRRTKRRDGGFHILVVGEVRWVVPEARDADRVKPWRLHVRLARAMAKSNTPAWGLVFDELGYVPDFVVADAGTGIGAAVRAHLPTATFIPGVWHVQRSILRALGMEAQSKRQKDIERHTNLLARDSPIFSDAAAWSAWWDKLATLVERNHLSTEKVAAQRANYEKPWLRVLPALAVTPELPISSGGLESLQRTFATLIYRRTQFANIERTNNLLDLVVAGMHGKFGDLAEVVALLRADANAHGGWTVALRATDDPQPGDRRKPYSSLRDPALIDDLARRLSLS